MRAAILLIPLLGCSANLGYPVIPQTETQHYCHNLAEAHRVWGGVAKFSGALAGSGGLMTLPISEEQKTLRWSIASTAVVLSAIAIASVYLSEDTAENWSKDCDGVKQITEE